VGSIRLIGGAPTVGKSYAACQLARELQIPWISTDMLREIMKRLVRIEDYPALFYNSNTTATQFLIQHRISEIVEYQRRESEEVWTSVRALIETDYMWESFIIEGVAILPELVAWLMHTKKDVSAVFLVNEDKERIREIIFTRGLWDDAEKYPDYVKEIEVQWVIAFNKWIMHEALKYNLPIAKTFRDGTLPKELFRI